MSTPGQAKVPMLEGNRKGALLTPTAPVTKKRGEPDSGHSPELDGVKRLNQELDLGVFHSMEYDEWQTVQKRKGTNSKANNQPRMDPEVPNSIPPHPTESNAATSVNTPRFSFSIKSETQKLRLPTMDRNVRRILGPDAIILHSSLSDSGKVCRYKTKSLPKQDPARDLNTMIKNQDQLRTMCNDMSITVEHYDPTSTKTEHKPPHAIASNVPFEYDDMEELKQLIVDHDPGLDGQIVSCRRITTRADGRSTKLVRIICSNQATADLLIKNGLKLEARYFRCQPPRVQPTPDRCYRCQQIGHTISRCQAAVQRCAKCGEDHRTSGCTRDRPDWRCLSCGEAHAVWYSHCPVNLKIIAERNKAEEERLKSLPGAQPVTQKTMTTITNAWNRTQVQSCQSVTAKVQEASTTLDAKLETMRHENASLKSEIQELKNSLESRTELLLGEIRSLRSMMQTSADTVTDSSDGSLKSPGSSASLKGVQRLADRTLDTVTKHRQETASGLTSVTQRTDTIETQVVALEQNMTRLRKHVDNMKDQMNRSASLAEQKLDEILSNMSQGLQDCQVSTVTDKSLAPDKRSVLRQSRPQSTGRMKTQ